MPMSLEFMEEDFILDITRMNNFLIPLSHPCIHERGGIRVFEGVVELRMMSLLA